MPRTVSPGFSSARNTAWLAGAPACGCTLAKPHPNSRLARVDRQPLGDVDELAAAVIAPPRIALGIFVGQHRALRFEHRARDDVLAGDQLDLRLLAATLAVDRRGDFRVGGGQGIGKKAGAALGGRPDSRGNRQDSTSCRRRTRHAQRRFADTYHMSGSIVSRATRHRVSIAQLRAAAISTRASKSATKPVQHWRIRPRSRRAQADPAVVERRVKSSRAAC